MVAHSSPLDLWLLLRRWLAASVGAALAAALPQPIALGSGHTLVPRSSFTDELGQTHTRVVHRYQGLRIWGSELVLHGASPAPSALAVLAPMSSPALPMLDAATPAAGPIDLDLTPSVSLDRVQEVIRPAFGGAAVSFSSPELVIYPRYLDLPGGLPGHGGLNAAQVHRQLAGYALAYEIQAEANTGHPLTDAWDYLVDAHSGTVLTRIPLNQGAASPGLVTDSGATVLQAQSAAPQPLAAGDTPALGVGRSLYNGTVQLNTAVIPSGFTLLDTTRGQGGVFGGNAVTDANHAVLADFSPGTLYTNATNDWGNGAAPAGALAPTNTPTGQTTAVDAAYGLQSTWNYFAQVHRRNGIDGAGSATYVRVNFGGILDSDNAFWKNGPFSVTITDGDRYWPFSNLTLLAHEFTHGVTGTSAGLLYLGESGGLNEATSDIFGVMADTYTRLGSGGAIPAAGTNWIIPRYLAIPAGLLSPMRYLYKPSKDFDSPDAWSAGLGGIDVHHSSGPMNRAFYFLSQGASSNAQTDFYSSYLPAGMTGIGNDAAARIWYRALTVYLTPSSNYLQARTAALRAAADLFPADASGNASRQTIAVRKAFGAINVGDPNATVDDFGIPTIAISITPSGTITPSGSNFTLNSTVTNPSGVAEVDYFVDQVLVAAAFNPPNFTVAQFDAAHLLANGTHSLSASAFAPSGNAGASMAVPFTVNNPVQQILIDPGLEGGGLTGWQGDAGLVVQTDYTGTVAHGGYRYAQFDRSAGRQSLTLSQMVAIPAGTTALFSLWTQTQGNPAVAAADTLQIQVQPAGGAATVLETLSGLQARPDWVQRSYDLSAYAGQTVTLSLASNINLSTGTAFLADDFVLACSGAPQVQVAVSLDPANFSAAPLIVDRFVSNRFVGPLYARVTGSTGSTAVTWSIQEGAGIGSLSAGATPTYQIPLLPGFYHVLATSVADPNVSARVSVQTLYSLNLVPTTATMEAGATLPFTAVVFPGLTPTFSVTGGSFTATGPNGVNYTAPATPGAYTLTVRDDSGGFTTTASATITVIPALQVSITPAALSMVTGSSWPLSATVSGSSNSNVVWTLQEGAAGGTITAGTGDAPSVYTAPSVPGVYHTIATSVADPARSAVLTVTVQANSITINPTATTTLIGGTLAFQAFATGNQAVTWSVPAGAGAISSSGVYTAPGSAGSYTVTASLAGGGLSASATVLVLTTNLSGSGGTFMNAADLAILANAWGTSGATVITAADLNRDGTVDDLDVSLFFSAFGGLP
jgi:Zn-dependent metalloprotease